MKKKMDNSFVLAAMVPAGVLIWALVDALADHEVNAFTYLLILGAFGYLWIAAILWSETKENPEYRRWIQLRILGNICMAMMFVSILVKFDVNIAVGLIIVVFVLSRIAGMIERRRAYKKQSELEVSGSEAESIKDCNQ